MACLIVCPAAVATPIYVDAASSCSSNCGTTWATAYSILQDAINEAEITGGGSVWVAEGSYGAITLKDLVSVYGGFTGTETLLSERSPATNLTYISSGSPVVDSTDNDATALLSGFVITGGGVSNPDFGAGMRLTNGSATIDQCIFTANTAEGFGGGVAILGGSPSFTNCVFHGNDGGWSGGAAFVHKSAVPTFLNCLFYDNRAWEGGAVTNASGQPLFVNCTFAENWADEPTLHQAARGGAIFDAVGSSTLRNCIIWDNHANVSGTESIYNSAASGGVTTATYSDIELATGAWPGTDNVNADPVFVDPANWDFHLLKSATLESPCIDTGDPTDDGAGQTDLDGHVRVLGGPPVRVDMGSDEFYDCNGNGIHDLCDTSCTAAGGNCGPTECGDSADCGANGIPDECETCTVADAPTAEPNGVRKNRYISFVPGNAGRHVAFRVNLLLMPTPFQSFNGTKMWVAAPVETCMNGAQTTPPCSGPADSYWASRLTCDPVYLDWSIYDAIHVYDDEMVPGGKYRVRAIDCLCDTATETNFSAMLAPRTSTKWGDVTGGFVAGVWTAPDNIVDIVDVTAVSERFLNYSTAPVKARADLDPDVPNRLVNIADLLKASDASNGNPYPFDGPTSCGGGGS